MKQGFFFDMDGVLFDSMPNHAAAWEEVMSQHGLPFTAEDCYINEGRTGQDVIREAILKYEHRDASDEEVWSIYHEKSAAFQRRGGQDRCAVWGRIGFSPIARCTNMDCYRVGTKSLFDNIDSHFPGIFSHERMITAFDVTYGKPNPEPYLKAWERSGLPKDQCCVVENAPLGVRAGKAAGLYTIAVNTGPLADSLLRNEGADRVFPDMAALLAFLKSDNH